MVTYRAFGLAVASGMRLPGLPEIAGATPDLVVGFPRHPVRCRPSGPLRHLRLPDGRSSLTVGRCGSRDLVRFPGLADFLVSGDGRRITCASRRGSSARVLAHLLLGQLIPLALSRQGRLVLHASAVATPQGAVAFLGAAGRGKSTLGASLVGGSFCLLADDGLLLTEQSGALAGVPSYPEIRLWPDALAALPEARAARDAEHPAGKKRLPVGQGRWCFSLAPVPMRRLYVLGDPVPDAGPGAVTIEPLPLREGFLELVRHSFRLEFDDPRRLRSEFEAIGRVASAFTLYRLGFAREWSGLTAVHDAVVEHLTA